MTAGTFSQVDCETQRCNPMRKLTKTGVLEAVLEAKALCTAACDGAQSDAGWT